MNRTVDKVSQILGGIGLDSDALLNPTKMDIDTILNRAKARKAEELIQDYVQRKPTAIKLVDKLLAGANSSIDALMVGELPGALDNIERIDRLITIAEGRRNGMLREIDRRRAVLGEALRRQVQEVEGEFEVIEKTAARGKSAASVVSRRLRPIAPMLGPAPDRKPPGVVRTRRETRSATG